VVIRLQIEQELEPGPELAARKLEMLHKFDLACMFRPEIGHFMLAAAVRIPGSCD